MIAFNTDQKKILSSKIVRNRRKDFKAYSISRISGNMDGDCMSTYKIFIVLSLMTALLYWINGLNIFQLHTKLILA